MSKRIQTIVGLLAVAFLLSCVLPTMAADPGVDKAFDALKTYEWGTDRSVLEPIDDAVAASYDDDAAREALETRLAALLKTDVSRAAKDYVCRKLSLIGSSKCVPDVAALLTDEKLSHMARYVLERMSCAESVAAMRDAMPKTSGKVKVGIINSLGVRRDAESIAAFSELLSNSDTQIAAAAIAALGEIGTPETAKALQDFSAKAPEKLQLPVADAQLACAEQLLADGKEIEAMTIYKSLSKPDHPKHVRVAAMRGLLAATGKQE